MKLELKKLIESLTPVTKNYLQNGAQRCMVRQGSEILIEDILYVMLEDDKSVLNTVLQHYAIPHENMLKALQNGVSSSRSESNSPVFSQLLIQWLEDAYCVTKLQLDRLDIDDAILMIALLENSLKYGNTAYFKVLESVDIQEALALLEGRNEEAQARESKPRTNSAMPTEDLEKYTTDMTQLARDGKIDPVLCRDEEIRQAIDILLRRRKNNPILVGEAGVGKTAVVEGLAPTT